MIYMITSTKRFIDLTQRPRTNYAIRAQYNIPQIESRLGYLRHMMYMAWKNTLPDAYLNNSDYIQEQHNAIHNELTPA